MSFWDNFQRGYEITAGNKNRQLGDLLKMAELKELGYNVTPKRGFLGFGGGYEIQKDQDAMPLKELQRIKLTEELQTLPLKRQMLQGQAKLFGAMANQFSQPEEDSLSPEDIQALQAELARRRASKGGGINA